MPQYRSTIAFLLLFALSVSITGAAELPLPPTSAKGQTVTPSFEGWYQNPDGSYTLSFGYFNRNTEEVVEIPVGSNNYIEPGDANQGQPTKFLPRRHWGVFGVKVPADFGYGRVVWTLEMNGQTFSIPGSLKQDWEVDALEGEAGSNNTPPTLKINKDTGQGPGGITSNVYTTSVGDALAVTVWAADDGKPVGNVRRKGASSMPINLTWLQHQGPGNVSFSETTHKVDYQGGTATTMVTFSEPGNYLLRVHAVDASGQDHEGEEELAMSGYAQCCWTNGFIPVTVNR